ncbi:hypothetical protein L6R29_22360, partial [Myxococcota bacterium]|nr:hypothetical protein [Myxococcota bacterium]
MKRRKAPHPALPREQGRERKSEASGILFFHDARCMHEMQTLPVPTSPRWPGGLRGGEKKGDQDRLYEVSTLTRR